jgi:hypothetical protein
MRAVVLILSVATAVAQAPLLIAKQGYFFVGGRLVTTRAYRASSPKRVRLKES